MSTMCPPSPERRATLCTVALQLLREATFFFSRHLYEARRKRIIRFDGSNPACLESRTSLYYWTQAQGSHTQALVPHSELFQDSVLHEHKFLRDRNTYPLLY